MFTQLDLQLLQSKSISTAQVEEQLKTFRIGFPWLHIEAPLTPANGLKQIQQHELSSYLHTWDTYLKSNASILKFVPASGAASRMFKDFYDMVEADRTHPEKEAEKIFFSNIARFAFYNDLNRACVQNTGKDINTLLLEQKYKTIIENWLFDKGLNYGQLPKGLLLFHAYKTKVRTAFEEHLAEGALYAMNSAHQVNIHFTVSNEHRMLFENHLANVLPNMEKEFKAHFTIQFSEQKPSTDTIAVDANNEPFRENGKLVFRPGGHGALIENLNDLNVDVIFIKNIDNVVPDALKNQTIVYKKVLAGLLVNVQKQCFDFLKKLENPSISDTQLQTIVQFIRTEFNYDCNEFDTADSKTLKDLVFHLLNRPIRVCGMVKNTGEPGGGPFLVRNSIGSTAPQILESSQINLSDPKEEAKMRMSTHFNPVDLVCGVRNYQGQKFDLTQFVDPHTGFISSKSKSGKTLKALELPGLWNGAMAEWNSIFVEVPAITFNPVKTALDLLRPEHQQ